MTEQITLDFDYYVLALLAKNRLFYEEYSQLIKPDRFKRPMDDICGAILKYLQNYDSTPDPSAVMKELRLGLIGQDADTIDMSMRRYGQDVSSIYAIQITDEKYIKDQFVADIKRKEILSAITDCYEIIRVNKDIDINKIVKRVEDAATIGINSDSLGSSKIDMYNIAVKYKNQYNPERLIHTGIVSLDVALGGGYGPGEVHTVIGSPKPLVGSTLIKLLDGTSVEIQELAARCEKDKDYSFWVYSCNQHGKIVPGKAHSVFKSRDVTETYRITFDNGATAECDHDHEWMLRDGTYKEAQDLVEGESMMPFLGDEGVINRIDRIKHYNPVPVYCFKVDEYHNFAVDLGDNSGVFSHNTGKSHWLVNVGAYNLRRAKNIFHVSLEMSENMVLAKYASVLSQKTQQQVLSTEEKDLQLVQGHLKESLKGNLFVKEWPMNTVNALDIRGWVSQISAKNKVRPDFLIVDYDDLMLPCDRIKGDNMYLDGGIIYSDLIKVAKYFDIPVLTCAQARRDDWGKPKQGESLEGDSIAQSAKKIQHCSSVGSLNFASMDAAEGFFLLDRTRRGVSAKIKLRRDFTRASFYEMAGNLEK